MTLCPAVQTLPGMAAKINLRIEQGATFRPGAWTWKAGTPSTAVDLTGCTARMHIRASQKAAAILLQLTTENGRITLGDAAGTIQLELDAETTEAITWTTAVYDLEIIHPDDTVTRLAEGRVRVDPEVTRPEGMA